MSIFIELSLIIIAATLVATVMRVFKQPLVVGYILTGVLVGPYGLNLLQSTENIEVFSKIGIAILLFIVGLNLNPGVIKEVGKVSLITGLGQVIFTSSIGFFIVQLLGFDPVTSLYVGIALTFGSTIIVLKILSDKGDLDKLYGKIAIGFLLVQDIIATLILLVISTISKSHDGMAVAYFVAVFIKGFVIVAILYIISKRILPRLSTFFAASQELLFLFSIAWGLGIASLFYYIGFSIEIGALIAGVLLSVSPFAHEIASRVKPLRDFFIVLFFILLGSQIVFVDFSSLVMPALILSAFVLVGNPLIVFFLMNLLGYKRKTSFMAGLTVAQISEFSLILISYALSINHVTVYVASLVTMVGIITIAVSTYLMLFSGSVYSAVEWFLKIIELRKNNRERNHPHRHPEIIIFGYDRVGNDFVKAALKLEKKYVVVDFDPRSIKRLEQENVPYIYGDADDVEFLHEIAIHGAGLIISTIPGFNTNMLLVKTYRSRNPKGLIVVISHNVEEAQALYLAGASYVVMPHYLGAHYASSMIARHGLDPQEFEIERNKHLLSLSKRAEKLL